MERFTPRENYSPAALDFSSLNSLKMCVNKIKNVYCDIKIKNHAPQYKKSLLFEK